jgi:hypothetical protein
MNDELTLLIGQAIHNCGVLEFFVNNSIRSLAKDRLLVSEVLTCPFRRRIELLGKLLKDRSDLKSEDISSLCNNLNKIREKRNLIAHNPIASDSRDLKDPYILLVRNAPHSINRMYAADVKAFVTHTSSMMQRLRELIPESTSCDELKNGK